ncbi:MAG: hypothetical protein ACREBS_09270 [Nitrososphaerales archaeon]
MATQEPSKKPRDVMRVYTQNIWQLCGKWEDWRSALIAGIRKLDPDLVAFAESIKTNEYDQTRDLLGSEYNLAYSKKRDSNGMGISIGSRWPIKEVDEVEMEIPLR